MQDILKSIFVTKTLQKHGFLWNNNKKSIKTRAFFTIALAQTKFPGTKEGKIEIARPWAWRRTSRPFLWLRRDRRTPRVSYRKTRMRQSFGWKVFCMTICFGWRKINSQNFLIWLTVTQSSCGREKFGEQRDETGNVTSVIKKSNLLLRSRSWRYNQPTNISFFSDR